MTRWKMAAFEAGLLLAATFANAAKNTVQIKVLDSQTHSAKIGDSNGVPKNCDFFNYDAYCHHSLTEMVTNTLLVQIGDGEPFRVACNVDTIWSKCVPLPTGISFEAVREKRGLTVYYTDAKGKLRKQFYAYATENGQKAEAPENTQQAGASSQEAAKCSFDSRPSGAEIILDGQFVGSTPSVLGLNTGKHVVQMSLPGYSLWKRELPVSSGSELTVNAVLEKAQ